MNKMLHYYSMIKSKWVPNNPITTFWPFIMTLFKEEKIEETNFKELSGMIEEKFGFSIPIFLLRNLIDKAATNNICSQKDDKIMVDLKKISSEFIIDDKLTNKFIKEIYDIVNEYIAFCDDENLSKEKAEETLNTFVEKYDVSIASDSYIKEEREEESDVYVYFFTEFVKDIFWNKKDLYNALIRICEGNMVRSILMNKDVNQVKSFHNQTIFLDTPVLLRVLGYYGEYIEQEYGVLIESWIKQGAKLFVYDHSYEEIRSILDVSSRWVENPNNDYSKSSMVTIYFIELGLTKIEIEEKIIKLEQTLNELGIEIYYTKFDETRFFDENEDEIKNKIKEVYSRKNTLNQIYETEERVAIDYDAKSIYNTYLIRNDNSKKYINEVSTMFVTNNRGIITATYEYHSRRYNQTLPPVVSDNYIGMLVLSNDEIKINEYLHNHVIASSYSAYKPTMKVKNEYIKKVESMKENNDLTEENYLLLKSYPLISDVITKETKGFTSDITDEVISDILETVKAEMVVKIKKESDEKVARLKETHEEEKLEIEKEKNREILEIVKKETTKRYKLAKIEFEKAKKVYYIIYYLIAAILVSSTIASTIINKISITTIVIAIFTLLQSIDFFLGKTTIVKKCLNKKKNILLEKYQLSEDSEF